MASSVLTYLDSYCERAGDAALWAEPLNAITNLFFIIAAVLAARVLLQHSKIYHSREGGNPLSVSEGDSRLRGNDKTIDLWLLIAALFAIGLGSGAWHLQPTARTLLMDVIPITLFMNIYLISALRRLFSLSWQRVFCWWGLYLLLTFAGQIYLPPDLLHGTVMYLPTYAAMVALTYGLARRDRATGKLFAIITSVWSLSLIARTVDLEICSQFELGTHFLWHTLNAWVLWRLLLVLIHKAK